MTKYKYIPNDLSDRVYLVTGGTGSFGFEVVVELSRRGARLILLCANVNEVKNRVFVAAMRRRFHNKQIYAISCDLRSKRSVDTFLRNWNKTGTARRLDGIICCATSSMMRQKFTGPGFHKEILAVNYLLQRYLINGLRPTMSSQPSSQDVRIIICTNSICEEWPEYPCLFISGLSEYLLKALSKSIRKYSQLYISKIFFQSQLVFGLFGISLQNLLNAERRPDGSPVNVKVCIVDPGLIRSKALIKYCFEKDEVISKHQKLRFRLITKSCRVGAKSIMYALFNPKLVASNEGSYVRDCRIVKKLPSEYFNEKYQAQFEHWSEFQLTLVPLDYRPYDIFHIPNFEH